MNTDKKLHLFLLKCVCFGQAKSCPLNGQGSLFLLCTQKDQSFGYLLSCVSSCHCLKFFICCLSLLECTQGGKGSWSSYMHALKPPSSCLALFCIIFSESVNFHESNGSLIDLDLNRMI